MEKIAQSGDKKGKEESFGCLQLLCGGETERKEIDSSLRYRGTAPKTLARDQKGPLYPSKRDREEPWGVHSCSSSLLC